MNTTGPTAAKEFRKRAIGYFNAIRAERRARSRSWNRWKDKHGGSITQELMFEEVPQVQWSANNEQEYTRLAQLYATMAIMEMLDVLLRRLEERDEEQ